MMKTPFDATPISTGVTYQDPALRIEASKRRSSLGWRGRFARLREYLGRMILCAGWASILGAGLVGAAIALHLLGGFENAEIREALKVEHAKLLHRQSDSAPVYGERERLLAFYSRFSAAGELPSRLERLNEIAVAHGVDFRRTDYHSAKVANSPLQQVALTIPVTTDFSVLYGLLADLMRDMPDLALQSLNVKRMNTETSFVEADIRLSLYLRSQP